MQTELRELEAEAAREAARPKLTYDNMLVEGFDVTVGGCLLAHLRGARARPWVR